MNYDTSPNYWLLPDDVGVPEGDAEGALIMGMWPVIAATAWQEYRQQGRGTVVIDEQGGPVFQPGSPCLLPSAAIIWPFRARTRP